MGEINVLDKLLGSPPCYLIGSLVELLTSIGPSPIQFCNFVKAYQRTAEKHKHFCAALNYVCLFTEIYRSLDEIILEQYWRVLYIGFKVVSNNYYFSNMFLPLTLRKVQQLIRERSQKSKNQQRFLVGPGTTHFCQKI